MHDRRGLDGSLSAGRQQQREREGASEDTEWMLVHGVTPSARIREANVSEKPRALRP